ncbi:MAG: hypothetical protein K2X03_13735 [Bryobacteraceae bacterium]|nr:hypothetical protein [Bryobacteraceae bacterium]
MVLLPQLGTGAEDDYRVYTESPRLFLNAKRLRLLRREKERQSIRWQQFDTLMAGKAAMPEPAFALALYSQVTQTPEPCQRAVAAASDVRQAALAADWCGVTPALATRLQKALTAPLTSVNAARDRALAAIALADRAPQPSAQALQELVEKWWRADLAPKLRGGGSIPRQDSYALFELLHAIRDNLNIELRDDAGAYFKELPLFQILSYYPAPFPSPENEFRVPFFTSDGEPDLNQAALSRAAELAMVAYDGNLLENQFIQGWALQDRFLMRGAFGIVYEFLWANPYQPGLSFHHLPNLYHDKRTGRLFVRSNWEEDASYFCYYDGQIQFFEEGKRKRLVMKGNTAPVQVGGVSLFSGQSPMKFTVEPDKEEREPGERAAPQKQHFFLVGLKPHTRFDIEVDDEELAEATTDAGGILALTFANPPLPRQVRIRETPVMVTVKQN